MRRHGFDDNPTLSSAATPRRSRGRLSSTESYGDDKSRLIAFHGIRLGVGYRMLVSPHLNVDQFVGPSTTDSGSEDLAPGKEELGITHLRYAFPWHVLEPTARHVRLGVQR